MQREVFGFITEVKFDGTTAGLCRPEQICVEIKTVLPESELLQGEVRKEGKREEKKSE